MATTLPMLVKFGSISMQPRHDQPKIAKFCLPVPHKINAFYTNNDVKINELRYYYINIAMGDCGVAK